jgi:hypothetical protein
MTQSKFPPNPDLLWRLKDASCRPPSYTIAEFERKHHCTGPILFSPASNPARGEEGGLLVAETSFLASKGRTTSAKDGSPGS